MLREKDLFDFLLIDSGLDGFDCGFLLFGVEEISLIIEEVVVGEIKSIIGEFEFFSGFGFVRGWFGSVVKYSNRGSVIVY